MPRLQTLTLAASVWALTACAAWVPHDPPPEALAAPCPPPVALPVRAMTQAEVETAWRVDRMALADCGERLDLLAQWSRAR